MKVQDKLSVYGKKPSICMTDVSIRPFSVPRGFDSQKGGSSKLLPPLSTLSGGCLDDKPLRLDETRKVR